MKSQVARLTLLATATLVFLCSITAFAQRGASLRGQVTDQLGAVIVGVTVTLTDANGKQQTTQTHSNGAYRFDNLAPGVYSLKAGQKGFATQLLTGGNLSAGTKTQNFQLEIGRASC